MTRDNVRINRYSRQQIMAEIGDAGQAKLLASKVLVIGAGGLGSPVISYLAAAGVGTIGIVDYDRVDISNLHRQLIHSESSIGTLKSESGADFVSKINSEVTVITHSTRLSELNAILILKEYDLVVDGSDNLSTRYLVSDACVILEIPLVFGSVLQFDGQVSVFDSPEGPCYRCAFPTPPPADSVPNCALAGVLGSVCGTIGTIMATEAVKILIGIDTTLRGKILVYSAKASEFDQIPVSKNHRCKACSVKQDERTLENDYRQLCGEPSTLTIDALSEYLESRAVMLLDVRSQQEFAKGNIPGSINLPVEIFATEFPKLVLEEEEILVLYCETGKRSSTCFALISQAIKSKSFTLEGGYSAWNSRRLSSGAR